MKEFELINKLFKPLVKKNDFAQDLADDVALIDIKNDEKLVVSKDLICEDVHFFRKDGGFKVASKLLLSNLSDIAATGALPKYYLLGLSKNKDFNNDFLQDFAQGLKHTQEKYNVSLIGGDTISTRSKNDRLIFSLTIFGITKKNKILSRQNAKDGDLIFMSGSVGDSYLGFKISNNENYIAKFNFDKKEEYYLKNRFFFPEPRIDLTRILLEKNLANGAIDISDGLLADLKQMCNSSRLSAKIYLDKIPTFFSKKNNLSMQEDLVNKGEDYEIIFSSAPQNIDKIFDLQKKLNIDISHIGQFNYNNNITNIDIYSDSTTKKIINFKKFGYEH